MGPLVILLMITCAFLPCSSSQSPGSLNPLLQDYAYRAFIRPKTAIIYQADPPSNMTEIKVAALRLKNGSLRKRGFSTYYEFKIPSGIIVTPYVERLVFVYHNLGNLSSNYYPLRGFTYVAPVLGLLTYSASNLSARNLPELQITTSGKPIFINFSQIVSSSAGLVLKCVFFNLTGFPNYSLPTSEKVCSATQQGHFSVVVKNPKKSNKKLAIIIGCVAGGVLVFFLIGLLIWWLFSLRKRKKIQKMEKAAEVGETLNMVTILGTRAPSAMVSRTQPILEDEHPPSNS